MSVIINKNRASLLYFKMGNYEQSGGTISDYSKLPRPFSSLALMIKGHAIFSDGENGDIEIKDGEMIFIPWNSTYKSTWHYFEKSHYVSIHFNFEANDNNKQYLLQKISDIDFKYYQKEFEFIYEHTLNNQHTFYLAMSKFYNICFELFENLKFKNKKFFNLTIKNAVSFIEENYMKDFDVSFLAKKVFLSQSRFYELFKRQTGYTPIDYKNYIRVKEAIKLLTLSNEKVEEITTKLGYNSSTYFRRIFKKFTGTTPQKFKKTNYNL